MRALRSAFVGACVAATIAQVTYWCAPSLATGELVWIAAFVVWVTVFPVATLLAALSVWEWVSPRLEEVIARMK